MTEHRPSPSHLYGVVDMGSNGIRFSITDLSPPTARSIPTVFQSRAAISLYDAQHGTGERGPIPQLVIQSVLGELWRFQAVCADFGVPDSNIKILATEAMRTAPNSATFRDLIKDATGYGVEILTKETEGRIGAMGIASSFHEVQGLVMDLGGGSTQLTWLVAKDGEIQTSAKGAISFPYGAAALTRLLAEVEAQGTSAKEALAEEMKSKFASAYHDLDIPPALLARIKQQGGLTIYLSGGGFRGWGYLLMSQSTICPYPIPVINGFRVSKDEFQNVSHIQQTAANHQQQEIFRVSKRRAAQVPAVAFLVDILCLTIPDIKEICFCQGGVREGFLFGMLDQPTRAINPLMAATENFAPPSSDKIADLLLNTLPLGEDHKMKIVPALFSSHPALLRAVANTMYYHSSYPKESASSAALHFPLTGPLASTSGHGISHSSRALLALILYHRWSSSPASHGTDLPSPHSDLYRRLCRISSSHGDNDDDSDDSDNSLCWWAAYMGKVAKLIGAVYPTGRIVDYEDSRGLSLSTERGTTGLNKRGHGAGTGIELQICARVPHKQKRSDVANATWLHDAMAEIEAIGKKKNRSSLHYASASASTSASRYYGFEVSVNLVVE